MAYMTVEHMRQKLLELYPGSRWQHKVNAMKSNQVYAAYMRIIEGKKE